MRHGDSFGDRATRKVEDRHLIRGGAGDEEPCAIRRRGEGRGGERTWLRESRGLGLLESKPSEAGGQDCKLRIES